MILSYQPCFVGDQNMICAGREPDTTDRAAVAAASAVILPQGCSAALYAIASAQCRRVFPDYTARFEYGGKMGQIRLFRKVGMAHPVTALFESVGDFHHKTATAGLPHGLRFPLVFKFDWGGEGFTVYRIENRSQLQQQIAAAARYERAGQRGFMLQALIPTGGRVLRVVRVGEALVSYWRTARHADQFSVSRARGARIDHSGDAERQRRATERVAEFGRQTGINLAGFDLIFNSEKPRLEPLMLEINYFFGREGLGGSKQFYSLLNEQIEQWLAAHALAVKAPRSGRCA